MQTINVKFVDFNTDIYKEYFLKLLSEKYNVVLSDNPDYIIYSVFGYEHLKYDCIRIFYTAECYTPNFNECDYAIGFDRLSFGDRYLRAPLYQLFQYRENFEKLKQKRNYDSSFLRKKTRFCNFIYSNCFTKSKRGLFFELLNQYKRVDSGGRYKNNIGGAVRDKIKFQSECKFSIAFENCSYDGYSTEKIMEAFASNTIPIYYGDPRITDDFNEESFINCHKYQTLEEVVERVKEIDSNDELYLRMINYEPLKIRDINLMTFLENIFKQDLEDARRRPFSHHSIAKEQSQLRHAFFENYIFKAYKKIMNQVQRIKTGTLLTSKRTK